VGLSAGAAPCRRSTGTCRQHGGRGNQPTDQGHRDRSHVRASHRRCLLISLGWHRMPPFVVPQRLAHRNRTGPHGFPLAQGRSGVATGSPASVGPLGGLVHSRASSCVTSTVSPVGDLPTPVLQYGFQIRGAGRLLASEYETPHSVQVQSDSPSAREGFSCSRPDPGSDEPRSLETSGSGRGDSATRSESWSPRRLSSNASSSECAA
jgi:hypothetical protein